MPGRPVAERQSDRTFPSVFQAWNPADNLPNEDRRVTMARHDLAWVSPGQLALRWDADAPGLGESFTPDSVETALKHRARLLELNPDIILLTEIRYRDAGRGFLPDRHRWWKRDEQGEIVPGWAEGGHLQLDFANPEYREHVARQAATAVGCGVFDGVMLDWWHDDAERVALARAVREAIGPDAAIVVNTNDRTCPGSAEYVNGLFMECTVTDRPEKWRVIAETLSWAEANLRRPRLNCLETWYHTSRDDLNLMRATTALALTHSDGYCLFSDPNPLPTPDHLHDWYAFWDTPLGRPLSGDGGRTPPTPYEQWNQDAPMPAGNVTLVSREFTGGTAVYNPMDSPAMVLVFDELRVSAATGLRAKKHYLSNPDGDVYLLAD